MKIKTASIGMVLLFTIGIITIVSFSLGCAEQEEAPVEPAEYTPAESEEVATRELEPISSDDITNIEWQWTSFQDSDSPEDKVTMPDPENYTLAFFADGTYYIRADCNSGSGTYSMEGNSITLDPPVTTLIACGPESMDGEFLSLLPTVEAAALEDGQLVLYPGNEGDKMFFVNGGEAEQ